MRTIGTGGTWRRLSAWTERVRVPPAWTGGQYSLLRATFGLGLGVAFAFQPGSVWMRAVAVVAAALFALGMFTPVAALVALAAWIALAAPATWVAHPWQCLVPLALVVHALLPRAPFGSVAALGRVDPGGGWRFAAWLRGLAWIGALALAIAAECVDTPSSATLPMARVAACIAGLVPTLRPFAWLVLVGEEAASSFGIVGVAATDAHVVAIPLVAARLLALGVLFDPAWIPARTGPLERVYYDGACGLCHRAVRFLLAEDVDGSRFRFAPLHGESFLEHVPESQRHALPDTVIVQSAGQLLLRSDAALHLLERLGGVWRVLGTVGGLVPRTIRDAGYDAVARVRKRLFRAPKEACPLFPAGLRARFEA